MNTAVADAQGETNITTEVFRLIYLGFGVALGTALVFGLWFVLAPLSSATIAPGTMVVASNRKTIQHLEGGLIRSIDVHEGDRVQAGQILVTLDDTRLRAAMDSLRPLLVMSRAQRARLLAERDGLEGVIFPDELSSSSDRSVRQILNDQVRLFNARRAALRSRLASLDNRQTQSEATVAGLIDQLLSQDERIELTGRELAGVARLAAKGYAPAQRALELRRDQAELEGERAALSSQASEGRHAAKYFELQKDEIRTTFVESIETDLQATERDIYDLNERMQTLTDQISHLNIRAPVDGWVVNMRVHTIGGVITPGADILDVVPENDRLVLEAHIRPQDIEFVRVGLRAEVRFPRLSYREAPKIVGTVSVVSADVVADELSREVYFVARVEIERSQFSSSDQVAIKAGMPAEVVIVERERTMWDYLDGPLRIFMARAMRE